MPLGGFNTDYYMTAKEHELREVSLVRKKVPKKVVIDNGSRVSLCSSEIFSQLTYITLLKL